MIEVTSLCKTYSSGQTAHAALRGVSFTVQPGEVVGVVGPSGSGKSTLMHILGLLDSPTHGQYRLSGDDVSSLSADMRAERRNQMIGFVFQQFFLLPKLTALQNVALPLEYRHTPEAEQRARAEAALQEVGLGACVDRLPQALSGGQQQRVAIARAFVGEPSLILSDEPTGALDSKTGQEVMDLLLSFNEEKHTTLLIITHDEKIARQCPRVIALSDGQVV